MPPNIYAIGFWRSLALVIHPLSARRANGFDEALEVGGCLECFQLPTKHGAAAAAPASEDGASAGSAATHPHAD